LSSKSIIAIARVFQHPKNGNRKKESKMESGSEFGFSIHSASLTELEEIQREASALDIEVSAPVRSSGANLAFDVSSLVDMAPYIYKTLVFINTFGATLKLAEWISEKLKKRGAAGQKGKPIFVLDISGKAYPIGNEADLEVVKTVMKAQTKPSKRAKR
jgi:hypothetical protein